MPTELQLKRPIDGVTFAIIRDIQGAAAALGHRAMLVGATARIILLEHVFGLPAGRATRDVDFAFAMETWEQFEALRQRLIGQHGYEADAHVIHKLWYRPNTAALAIPVDLMPFGALGADREEIRWPPDMAIVMSRKKCRRNSCSAPPASRSPTLCRWTCPRLAKRTSRTSCSVTRCFSRGARAIVGAHATTLHRSRIGSRGNLAWSRNVKMPRAS
jgi:hypothetical protein